MAAIEVKLIRPRKEFVSPQQLRTIIRDVYKETAEGVRTDLRKATATWEHKPKITLRFNPSGGVTVEVIGEVFEIVDTGAKPHTITPVKARFLRIAQGFKPKTRPRILNSNAGGKSGPSRSVRIVRHPGFVGRKFLETAAEKWQGTMSRRMNQRIANLVR